MAPPGYNPPNQFPPLTTEEYAPSNQNMLFNIYATVNSVVNKKTNNYGMYYTSLNYGVGSATRNNAVYINTAQTAWQEGYRIDVSDVRDVLNINDKVVIGGSDYTVKLKETPEIEPIGKYVAFQDISQTPITVHPDVPQVWKFDISINISELS
jgi:hypothetical protein